MATTNTNLEEVALGQTFGQWLNAFNGNMGKIDALPLPIAYGKNTTMEYVKFSNGKVFMWGRIEMGTKYPCSRPGTAAGGYLSDRFTIDFPLALTKSNPAVLSTVMADKYSDVQFYMNAATYTNMTGCFYCPGNDSSIGNNKSLNVFVIGDWK